MPLQDVLSGAIAVFAAWATRAAAKDEGGPSPPSLVKAAYASSKLVRLAASRAFER